MPFTYSVRLRDKKTGTAVVEYTASRISSVGNPEEVQSEADAGDLFGEILTNGTLNIGVDWGDADAIHEFAEAKNSKSGPLGLELTLQKVDGNLVRDIESFLGDVQFKNFGTAGQSYVASLKLLKKGLILEDFDDIDLFYEVRLLQEINEKSRNDDWTKDYNSGNKVIRAKFYTRDLEIPPQPRFNLTQPLAWRLFRQIRRQTVFTVEHDGSSGADAKIVTSQFMGAHEKKTTMDIAIYLGRGTKGTPPLKLPYLMSLKLTKVLVSNFKPLAFGKYEVHLKVTGSADSDQSP